MKNRFSLLIAGIFMLAFVVAAVNAAPPISYYIPLETTDPTCTPGDTNCDVELLLPSSGDITNWNAAYDWADHSTAGYLTGELDGDATNEIQELTLSGSTLNLSRSTGAAIDLSPFAGANTDNQTLSLSGSTLSITGGNNLLLNGLSVLWSNITGIPADIADGDNDTQLTEAQVDGFVANNGYLTTEVDGSITNEIQTLSFSGSSLSLSGSGGNINLSSLRGIPSPWFGTDDNESATDNTENMYVIGNVAIGTITPSAQLTVNTVTAIGALEAGSNAKAIGNDSISFGNGTTATGAYSVATGLNTGAIGLASATFGRNTLATGAYGFAAGDSTHAKAAYSAAFGRGTTAGGVYSFVGGDNVSTTGTYSAAFGRTIDSSGNYSFSMGQGIQADSFAEIVVGNFNIPSGGNSVSRIATEPAFVIGNGINDANRSNAMTVLKSGKVGIGTINPNGQVAISDDTLVSPLLDSFGSTLNLTHSKTQTPTIGIYGPGITFSKPAGGTSRKRASINSYQTGIDDDEVGLAFSTHNSSIITHSALEHQMTITHNGNIGIGTIAPDSKLSVVGLPSGTTDVVTPGTLAGAVCITDAGNMYIDTDGTCAN